MPEHYDSLETRDAVVREREQFARLCRNYRARDERARLGEAPRRHRSKIDYLAGLAGEAAGAAQIGYFDTAKESPPFGGLNVAAPGKVRRLLMSPGPIFEPEGEGADWWGAARALYAAGFRSGQIVHNSFAYHLTPGGFILESGAHALGCAVIPGGVGNTRAAARCDRALSAVGICRDAGLPQDPARYGAK